MIDKIAKSVASALDTLNTALVTAYRTKGGRYVLTITKTETPPCDSWRVSVYENGRHMSSSCGHPSEESAFKYAEQRIKEYRHIDGINFYSIPSRELSYL